jgi:hypothetical protein
MKLIYYRPLTALLAATIALAIGSSDLMAAKKDKDDKGSSRGKGKKEQVQRGGGSNRVAQARPSAPRPQQHKVASRSKPQARPSVQKHDNTRLAVQRSNSKPHGNSRKRSDDIARHQLASSSGAARARAAESKNKSIDRSAALARSRDRDNDKARDRARIANHGNDKDRARIASSRDVNRSRTDVRRQIDNRNVGAVASRSNNFDRNRDNDRDRHTHSRRDRSHYSERHDHDHNHGYDWYRSNGYVYDNDYYRTYHRHRYYNDSLGVFLFSLTAPPAYVYESAPAVSYDSGYGYGYETRVAVQEELARAGYYEGSYDGVVGPGTRSAIYAYQQDYGLYASGRIDDQLLQSLGLTN